MIVGYFFFLIPPAVAPSPRTASRGASYPMLNLPDASCLFVVSEPQGLSPGQTYLGAQCPVTRGKTIYQLIQIEYSPLVTRWPASVLSTEDSPQIYLIPPTAAKLYGSQKAECSALVPVVAGWKTDQLCL